MPKGYTDPASSVPVCLALKWYAANPNSVIITGAATFLQLENRPCHLVDGRGRECASQSHSFSYKNNGIHSSPSHVVWPTAIVLPFATTINF